MGIEAIKGAAATYQGSTSAPEVKVDNRPKAESPELFNATDPIASTPVAQSSSQNGSENDENSNSKAQEQRNAQIRKAVEDINRKSGNTEAIFGIHDATNRVTIKIINKETKDVIREVPPEKTLDMIAKVWEIAGLMVDEKR